jgi:hypothetical protein
MTFDDLTFVTHPNHGLGVRATAFFSNGYGVSVIRSKYSYGGEDGFYEAAVFAGDAANHALTYDTPVTNDVEGWLSPEAVTEFVQKVEALPPRSVAA